MQVNRTYAKGFSGNPARYEKYIRNAALTHQLDPMLIKAVIKVESDFNPYAVSSSGAKGLMQLMPETAMDMEVGNLFDPQENINGGTKYLKNLLLAYDNDLSRSLAAYNAGPGKVDQDGPLPRIQETRDYVQRVIQFYRSYQQAGQVDTSQAIRVRKLVTAN